MLTGEEGWRVTIPEAANKSRDENRSEKRDLKREGQESTWRVKAVVEAEQESKRNQH